MKTVVLFLLICGLACHSPLDCADPANASSAECNVINAVIDCAGADASAAVKAEIATDITTKNWGDLEILGLKYGGCVVAEVFADYIGGASTGSGSAAAAVALKPGAPTADEAKAQYAALRVKLWPGKKFKTKSGAL